MYFKLQPPTGEPLGPQAAAAAFSVAIVAIPSVARADRVGTDSDDGWKSGVSTMPQGSNCAAEQVHPLRGLDYLTQIGSLDIHGLNSQRLIDANNNADEDMMSITSSGSTSPSTSSLHSAEVRTSLDISIPVWEGDDPARIQHLDELGPVPAKSSNLLQVSTYDIHVAINRDARTGNGLPCLRPTPNTSYEPSERSNVTDLGAHEREVTYEEADVGHTPTQFLLPHGRVEVPLQDRLLGILRKIPGHDEKKGFFPEKQLLELVTEEYTRNELQVCFEGRESLDAVEIESIAKTICGTEPRNAKQRLRYKKIFTILVLCERPQAILRFIEEGVSDLDLPLHKFASPDGSPNIFNLVRKNCQEKLQCFRGWTSTAVWRFEEWQWTTMAPFFHHGKRKDIKHFILPDQVPLPFNMDSRFGSREYQRLEFEGGFSNVFKASLHPEHHDLYKPGAHQRDFAIKCLLSRDREEFKREADTLMKFGGDAHKHLISLLATYEQFGKFYLVFPWAEAHLQSYWKQNPEPDSNYEAVHWLAEQCSGIADALIKIHRYETSVIKQRTGMKEDESQPSGIQPKDRKDSYHTQQLFGRHGDIKPDNILWFRDPSKGNDRGVLKISDFGLTEFTTRHSQCYKRNTQIAHSTYYRPPECDLEGAAVGQSYDIWTLGCLYLELITWQLGGWSLLQAFRERRRLPDPMRGNKPTETFFEIVRCQETNTVGAMVKPAVTEFILDLHDHPACTDYFHDFLNLVAQDMLLVKSPNPKERGRAGIEQLNARLLKMLLQCRNDTNYASRPTRWPRRQADYNNVAEAVETNVAKVPAEILRLKVLRIHRGRTLVRDRVSPLGRHETWV